MIIDQLEHGISKGSIGVYGPKNGSAWFSNFSYQITDEIEFSDLPVRDLPVGIIKDWKISESFPYTSLELDKYPGSSWLDNIDWVEVNPDLSGIVDIARYKGRKGREPDCVYARTFIESDKIDTLELAFGYSDAISLFFNGQILFSGNSAYQKRDPSFLGIIGTNDVVYLPLKEGSNELLLCIAESFGGWGFICQDAKAIYLNNTISKLWESEAVFETSESVLYDKERNCLYISNFDQFNVSNPAKQQYISKITLDGQIEHLKWVDSINNPLGMTMYNGNLFVAERNSIAEIDPETATVIRKIEIPGSVFLNDIAIDKKGDIFISDSRKNVIWKVGKSEIEEWLTGDEILDPNTIYIAGNKLLFGNSGDSYLKSADLKTKEINKIAKFPEGFIDGIRIYDDENYLVSLWRGKIYKVSLTGNTELIFHTQNLGEFTADFE